MPRDHHYAVRIRWTGDRGTGTSGYRDYSRANVLTAAGKHDIDGSADRTFHGDAGRWNPEELLLAALSECHMLSYLHVATRNGVVVTGYTDEPTAVLRQEGDGGAIVSATLRPVVTVSDGDTDLAQRLHEEASRLCFIATSVAFPVQHEPRVVRA